MKIIVCVKQVPDTNEVKINQETGTLIRDGVASIINPDDKHALEAALTLKEQVGATVAVVSMGPPQAKDALKEALAMGCDQAYLVTDRAFGGSDTWATATILAAAIEKIGGYDLILCGRQAIDGDTAQVGPEVAEFLDLPQITYVSDLSYTGGKLEVTRFTETGSWRMEVATPALLTVIQELNSPRYPTVKGIFHAYDGPDTVQSLTLADLEVDPTQIGLKGSPTNVLRSFVPVRARKGELVEGNTAREQADALTARLHELKLV